MNRILKVLPIVVLLIALSCKSYFIVDKAESDNIELNDSLPVEASEYETEIKPYRDSLSASMDEVLNQSETEMSIGIPEGKLGNFSADLTLEIGNKYYNETFGKSADFSLLNNGGLRTSLPQGDITRGKIFELMPFENELVAVTLSREKTVELFQFIASKSNPELSPKKGVPVSWNVKVITEGGELKEVYIGGQKLQDRSYTIITSDYLSNGGDNMSFFLSPVKTEKLGVKLRDAIMEYVILQKQDGKPITAKTDKRISYATE